MNTQPPVKIFVKEDVHNCVKKNIHEYNDALSNLIQGTVHVEMGTELVKLLTNDVLRLITEKKSKNSIDLTIRNLLLKTIQDLERETAFGSFFSLLFVTHMYKTYAKKELAKNISSSKNDILAKVAMCSKASTEEDLDKVLKIFCDSNLIYQMINKIFDLVGADGQIFIDNKVSNENTIEIIDGHRFFICPHELFQSSVSFVRWERKDARCIVIDGIIERPSEIESILSKLAETKEPALLVCRGYSEDVISTLATNYRRKILDVIPLVVPYDLLGANLINDVAIVCNTDIISSLKGQLISTLTIDDLVTVKHTVIDTRKSLITCDGSQNRVRLQIDRLLENREKNSIMEKNDIIDQRLSCLSAKCAKIKFGKSNMNKVGILIDRMERSIFLLKEVCRFGHIKTSHLISIMQEIPTGNPIAKTMEETLVKLQKVGYEYVPARSVISGIRTAISLFEMLNKTGVIIVNDK